MTSIRVQDGPVTRPVRATRLLEQLLLLAGVCSSIVYVVADQVCALRYPGYSILHQAISELSAQGAPTATIWSRFMPFYGLFFLLFVIGVFRASRGNRVLRIDAYVMLAFAVLSPVLWSLVPMHQRGAPGNWQDVGHIAMAALSALWIAALIAIGASAFGTAFRKYSIASALLVLLAAGASFLYVPLMIAVEPTPWLGVIERVSLYTYQLWIAVLAITLVRRS